jgi:hypothetical protein
VRLAVPSGGGWVKWNTGETGSVGGDGMAVLSVSGRAPGVYDYKARLCIGDAARPACSEYSPSVRVMVLQAADAGVENPDVSSPGLACDGRSEPLARMDENGKLAYGVYANEGQDRAVHVLPDFSYAGYRQGGVALPVVPVAITLHPAPGDARQRIQDAIDKVSSMPRDAEGLRGAVLLTRGVYEVEGTLTLAVSGVVLRGEGQGSDGTVILATRRKKHNLIEVRGNRGAWEVNNTRVPIVTGYVPVGSRSFEVTSARHFSVGDTVGVLRKPNQKWIDDLAMGQWGWIPADYEIAHERRITAIDGNKITIDIPLVDTMERQWGGGAVFLADLSGRVEQAGVESLRLVSAFDGPEDESHGWKAVLFSRVANSWVREISAVHFGYAAVSIEDQSSFNTVQDSAMLEPVSRITGGRRYSFNLGEVVRDLYVGGGVGNLFQRCYSEQSRHDFVSGARNTGPNVWLDCYAHDSSNDAGPHHRWSAGLLFDNVSSFELHVENRRDSGTGHGWSGAQTMFWNSLAGGVRCDAPLGAMNWTVGSMGERRQGKWAPEEPFGWWESQASPVEPRSLYLQQLKDRLGAAAVDNVTTPEQRRGRIWDLLAAWAGEGRLADAAAGGNLSSHP